MESQRILDRLPDWEIKAVSRVVESKSRKWRYLKLEFDDLKQDCLLRWCSERLGRRSPYVWSFLVSVVESELVHIIERANADKRRASMEAVSLDQPLHNEEDAPTLKDTLAEEKDFVLTADLKMDVAILLQELSPKQHEICRLILEGHKITEVSKKLNTPRSTIYDEIGRIEYIAEKLGLRGYFDKNSDVFPNCSV